MEKNTLYRVVVRNGTGAVLCRTTASKTRTEGQIRVWALRKFTKGGDKIGPFAVEVLP